MASEKLASDWNEKQWVRPNSDGNVRERTGQQRRKGSKLQIKKLGASLGWASAICGPLVNIILDFAPQFPCL